MKNLSRFKGTALLAAAVFGITAAAVAVPGHAQSTLQAIQERGKLLAGVRFDNPPSGYIDTRGNNIGFGPDLARAFAKHLGVELELVQVTSKNRIPLLLNGQIDADIGTTTPTKARDEVVDFSHVYVVDQARIMVRKGASTDPEDYFNSDTVAGGMQGSFYIDLWKQHSPDANMKEYQEFPDVVVALIQGKIDVLPTNKRNAYEIIEKLGARADNIEVGGAFFEDFMAIGLRENDSDWRDWVNWTLQRMWGDGSYQALYEKHFKTQPAFELGDAGRLQPGYEKVAKENDFWSQ
ncbi:transporter substrate-binding domain-containing protein [Pelagibius litoralis]|uniref:Transporter substrate-binding domain-containing protein n=1 Tax=Pelagibius litoralis TaxID=374515 RepID=A0A967EZU0_9PROT|nr:transporter substrate-binding domain-containing protein [Pelagibius litoralis]NIA70445.1 transporter substrate-binding domain-containing protein [Pelagibius litoralis]